MISKKEQTITYTVEQCNSCKNMTKRKFKSGDYLFKETESCPSCKTMMRIEKIFGETIKE